MSLPLIFGAVWVIAGAITAALPMRLQRYPGLPLLVAAPILLTWIGWVHGFLWMAVGLFAFLSMFRRPLNYLIRRALGLRLPDLPPEFRPPDIRPEKAGAAGRPEP